MKQLDDLLNVQEHDTAIAQLVYKRANLPELAKHAAALETLAAIEAEREPVAAQRQSIKLEQGRIEDEVTIVEAKIVREDQKLYSGTVTGVKELQALQDEIASLKRYQSTLEDQVIEQMELADPVDATLGELAERSTACEARVAALETEIAAAQTEIDAALEVERAARDVAAAAVEGPLLARYETIREDMGGVGIARLKGSVCDGCHMQMSAMEADRAKKAPADEIVTCDNCERLLVR